ncbi:MAG: BMP family ABC transporter substrate-binding protein [Fimbriimonadaceae bacterium]
MANRTVELLPAKYTGNWDNIDLAKQAANILYDGGADIVYHAAGRAGLGVIRAAEEKGKFAIGVDRIKMAKPRFCPHLDDQARR